MWVVKNYTFHLQYILIRLQKQKVDALESSEEGNAYRLFPYQPSSFLLSINPSPSLVTHMERVVPSKFM